MIQVLEDMDKCVGCASCAQRCKNKSITMKPDKEGFLFPCINQSICIDCGLCTKVCPVSDKTSRNNDSSANEKPLPQVAYACWSNSEEIRLDSSSGGLFSAFAENTLNDDGFVFGAAFDDNFQVCHVEVNNTPDLGRLRGSKYVQSSVGNCFFEAEALLKASKKVLFSGTPCQIAGLKSFLGKEYDNLLTIDLSCHGVPSPKIWGMYLDYMQETFGSQISSVSFRNKNDGWTKFSMKIDFSNGKTYFDNASKETYFIGYGKSVLNRKCCYQCQFKLKNTKSDITLADFWGIEKLPGIDVSDNKGVSLVVVNTPKGKSALSGISDKIFIQERPFEEGVKGNPRLVSPVRMPEGRNAFFQDLIKGRPFHVLRRKYMDNYTLKYKLKVVVKSVLSIKFLNLINTQRSLKGKSS